MVCIISKPSYPNPRLESSRTGWPSLLALDNGSEIIISHSTQNSNLNMVNRSTIGSGTWNETNINEVYLIWNRSAVGGPDGNTIHTVALTEPVGTNWTGQLWQGLNGALLFTFIRRRKLLGY